MTKNLTKPSQDCRMFERERYTNGKLMVARHFETSLPRVKRDHNHDAAKCQTVSKLLFPSNFQFNFVVLTINVTSESTEYFLIPTNFF